MSELRIDHGPGYRIYFKPRGRMIEILLAGGTKRTRAQYIKSALHLVRALSD